MVSQDDHDAVAVLVAKSLAVLSALLCLVAVTSRCFTMCKAAQKRALDREDRDDPCYRLRKSIRYTPLSTVALQS